MIETSDTKERWYYSLVFRTHMRLTGERYRRSQDACPCCGRPEGNKQHGAEMETATAQLATEHIITAIVKSSEHVCILCHDWWQLSYLKLKNIRTTFLEGDWNVVLGKFTSEQGYETSGYFRA